MSTQPLINVAAIQLDHEGRVVLTDADLVELERSSRDELDRLVAGGNSVAPRFGPVNPVCSNSDCGFTTNGICGNGNCGGASNGGCF